MYSVKRRAPAWPAAVSATLLRPTAAVLAADRGPRAPEPVGAAGGLTFAHQAGEGIPALVAEAVAFFVAVLVCYLFVGTAAGFVEAQWGALTGSAGRAGPHLAGKIGQLALAVILALLAYPLVSWVAGVLLGS